jgi:23S rRNA pseudouridine2605 synthase
MSHNQEYKSNNTESEWRLSKYLSIFAQVSRREAEKEIMSGSVKINNELPKNAAVLVTKTDIVMFKNRRIMPSVKILEKSQEIECFSIYKPTGVIVTRSDEKNRKTVYNLLPKEMQNFHYIGRLDFNSEGLLFFTNNPKFARDLENPKNKIPRVYHVKVHGMLDEKKLNRMQKGVIIEGEGYRPEKISVLPRTSESSTNTWLEITLTTGKNREIRKLCEFFNLQVVKLVRFSFGAFSIKDFSREKIHKISEREVKKFLKLTQSSV